MALNSRTYRLSWNRKFTTTANTRITLKVPLRNCRTSNTISF